MGGDELPGIRWVQAKIVAENMRVDLTPEDEDDGMTVSSKALLAMLVCEYVIKGDLELSAGATLPEMLYELRRRLGITADREALREMIGRIPDQVTSWHPGSPD